MIFDAYIPGPTSVPKRHGINVYGWLVNEWMNEWSELNEDLPLVFAPCCTPWRQPLPCPTCRSVGPVPGTRFLCYPSVPGSDPLMRSWESLLLSQELWQGLPASGLASALRDVSLFSRQAFCAGCSAGVLLPGRFHKETVFVHFR